MDTLDLINVIEALYLKHGILILFLSSFVEISPFGWIIPGGTIITLGGYFAFGKPTFLYIVILFSWLGAWLTFVLAYYFGMRTGDYFIKKLKQEKNAKRAESLLKKHGPMILTTSLLANLTRFWIAFIAGSQRYKFTKFLFYSGAASLTWTALMVAIGYLAGSERENLEKGIASLGILSWVLLFVALAYIYLKIKKEFQAFKNEEPAEQI